MADRVLWDCGNSDGKWFWQKPALYDHFPHAVIRLTAEQWMKAVGTGTPGRGMIKVNGVPYAVGDAARRYTLPDRPKGAARYTEDYYGPLTCFMFTEAFKDGENHEVALYASHAPQDLPYAPLLVEAVKRKWTVLSHRGTQVFDVVKVSTFDEPMGVFAHYAFDHNGKNRPDAQLSDRTVLVLDPGGYTTDKAEVDPGGHVDGLSLASSKTGTIAVMTQFEDALRRKYLKEFQKVNKIDISRLEAALITGFYSYGERRLPCKDEAHQAKAGLINDIVQIVDSAGGAANFDMALVGNGGGALIIDPLRKAYPALNFVLVEPRRELSRFCTVFGGAKLATMVTKVKGQR